MRKQNGERRRGNPGRRGHGDKVVYGFRWRGGSFGTDRNAELQLGKWGGRGGEGRGTRPEAQAELELGVPYRPPSYQGLQQKRMISSSVG